MEDPFEQLIANIEQSMVNSISQIWSSLAGDSGVGVVTSLC